MPRQDSSFYVQLEDGDRLITINEAARIIRFHRDYVSRLIKKGLVLAYKPSPTRYLVSQSSLLQWATRRPCGPQSNKAE